MMVVQGKIGVGGCISHRTHQEEHVTVTEEMAYMDLSLRPFTALSSCSLSNMHDMDGTAGP